MLLLLESTSGTYSIEEFQCSSQSLWSQMSALSLMLGDAVSSKRELVDAWLSIFWGVFSYGLWEFSCPNWVRIFITKIGRPITTANSNLTFLFDNHASAMIPFQLSCNFKRSYRGQYPGVVCSRQPAVFSTIGNLQPFSVSPLCSLKCALVGHSMNPWSSTCWSTKHKDMSLQVFYIFVSSSVGLSNWCSTLEDAKREQLYIPL